MTKSLEIATMIGCLVFTVGVLVWCSVAGCFFLICGRDFWGNKRDPNLKDVIQLGV